VPGSVWGVRWGRMGCAGRAPPYPGPPGAWGFDAHTPPHPVHQSESLHTTAPAASNRPTSKQGSYLRLMRPGALAAHNRPAHAHPDGTPPELSAKPTYPDVLVGCGRKGGEAAPARIRAFLGVSRRHGGKPENLPHTPGDPAQAPLLGTPERPHAPAVGQIHLEPFPALAGDAPDRPSSSRDHCLCWAPNGLASAKRSIPPDTSATPDRRLSPIPQATQKAPAPTTARTASSPGGCGLVAAAAGPRQGGRCPKCCARGAPMAAPDLA
jgi:hypothetical protein